MRNIELEQSTGKIAAPSWRQPAISLGVCLAAFTLYLAYTVGELPDRVASHFDLAGNANGWMSRTAHITCMSAVGFGLPALFVGAGLLVGWLPPSAINLPKREYWLAPGRREQTQADLIRYLLWMGCLCLVLISGIQQLVVDANRHVPPMMSNSGLMLLLGAFGLATGIWSWRLIRYFGRPGEPPDRAL